MGSTGGTPPLPAVFGLRKRPKGSWTSSGEFIDDAESQPEYYSVTEGFPDLYTPPDKMPDPELGLTKIQFD